MPPDFLIDPAAQAHGAGHGIPGGTGSEVRIDQHQFLCAEVTAEQGGGGDVCADRAGISEGAQLAGGQRQFGDHVFGFQPRRADDARADGQLRFGGQQRLHRADGGGFGRGVVHAGKDAHHHHDRAGLVGDGFQRGFQRAAGSGRRNGGANAGDQHRDADRERGVQRGRCCACFGGGSGDQANDRSGHFLDRAGSDSEFVDLDAVHGGFLFGWFRWWRSGGGEAAGADRNGKQDVAVGG